MPDQGVHSAQRVVPVGIGEFAGKRVVDHLVGALPGVALQVGRVDQARGVYLGVHTAGLPAELVHRHRTRRKSRRGPDTRPVQSHVLARAQLGDLVDVFVGDDADHRIATGDRMVGSQDHR